MLWLTFFFLREISSVKSHYQYSFLKELVDNSNIYKKIRNFSLGVFWGRFFWLRCTIYFESSRFMSYSYLLSLYLLTTQKICMVTAAFPFPVFYQIFCWTMVFQRFFKEKCVSGFYFLIPKAIHIPLYI